MGIRKFISRLLRMKGFCVTWYSFSLRGFDVGVKPRKTGCRCSECGRRCEIIHITTFNRVWLDIVVCCWPVRFYYRPKEIYCPTHGRLQEEIPWAAPYSHVTYRFEYCMLIYCQIMTQKAAARLLHISSSTLSDILHRTITRIRSGHRIRGLRTIGVDEISYCKGHKYATIVYDLDKSCVLWIGAGKGREVIDNFFVNVISEHQRNNIRFASCDMSKAYMNSIKEHCPNVVLVIDHFHVTKALNDAVDKVRKEEWRKLLMKSTGEQKVLKGLRWLIFRHSSNRSKSDTRILNNLKNGNNHIYRAWLLKDEFEQFWSYTYPASAENFLKVWITKALKSRMDPLKKFAMTLRNHFDNIITFVGTELTNAIGEGINRIIRIVKNRASGFRTLKAFSDLIYLVVGDVDIPVQIPRKFRTV